VDSGEHDEAAGTQTVSRVHAAGTGMDCDYAAASVTEYRPNMNNAKQADSVTDRRVDSGAVIEEDLDPEDEEHKASEVRRNQCAPRRPVPHPPAAVSKKSPIKLNLSFLSHGLNTPTSRTERERAAVAELEHSTPIDQLRRTPPSDYSARVGKHGAHDDDDDDDDDLFSPDLKNFNGERSSTRPLASPRDSIEASPRDSIEAFKARWSPRNPHVTDRDVDPVLQRAERAMGILDAFISRSSRDMESSAENLSQHWAIVHDQYEVLQARTARQSQRPPSSKDLASHTFSEGGGGGKGGGGGAGEEEGGSDADAPSLSQSFTYDSDSPSKSKSLIAHDRACNRDWQGSSSTPSTPGPGTLANTSTPTTMCGRRRSASPSSWTPSWMSLFSPAMSQQDTPSGITGKEA
jgi:hypothetical protein